MMIQKAFSQSFPAFVNGRARGRVHPTPASRPPYPRSAQPRSSSAFRLALFQPDIPQNTGTMLRMAACLGLCATSLSPPDFPCRDRAFRRAGMDYLDLVAIRRHVSWARFRRGPARGGVAAWCWRRPRRTALHRFQLCAGRYPAGRPRIGGRPGRSSRVGGCEGRNSHAAGTSVPQRRDISGDDPGRGLAADRLMAIMSPAAGEAAGGEPT